MKINRIRPIAVTVAALLTPVAGVTLTSQPAGATAYGCVQCGSVFTIKGVGIRKGTFCHEVNGGGTYVNYVYAQATVNNALLGTTCNYGSTGRCRTASAALTR